MAIDDNASYELTGYQVKDLASKIRAKADSNSLASVATSGLYSDLTGAPTIPTVYNGTLTIQQNGTTLGTFSANQDTNETINITGGGGNATKYYIGSDAGTIVTFYKDSGLTTAATYQEVIDALAAGEVMVYSTKTNSGTTTDTIYVAGSYSVVNNNGGYTISLATLNDRSYSYRQFSSQSGISNLNANAVFNNSARFFTQDMVGATSSANGRKGYVPQPLIADKDKFLKGDGTWTAVSSGSSYTAGNGISIDGNNEISIDDTVVAEVSDLPTDFTGATSSVAGANGLVPAPAAGDEGKALHGDGTWKDTTAKLVEMSYGESNAWAKFIAAYNAGSIVYCRASSNANPATGSQTRKAFMAYVSNATSPTSVEFQYVRSQSSKTDSQQFDQVFVYKLTNASGGTWTVESRNMGPKIVAGTGMSSTFTTGANATITLNADTMTGATSSAAGTAGVVPAPAAGDQSKVLTGAGVWGALASEALSWTTLTGNTTSITLDAGTWLVIATVNCLISADGSFLSYVSWLGQTKTFQGYRVSGQNRTQSQFTFVDILSPTAQTTYTATQSGNTVDLHTPQWVAIKIG